MNHLESSFTGKNDFWRYLVMIVIVYMLMNTLGSVPLLVSIFIKAITEPGAFTGISGITANLGILGLDQNYLLFVMVFPFITGLVAFILLVRQLHFKPFANIVNGTRKIRWKRFFISAAIWIILQSLFLMVYLKSDPSNFTINNTSISLFILIGLSLLIIPFQASFEEILFRGYFMQGFARLAGNRWVPLIITSVLFGMLHSLNPEVKEYGFLTMIPQYVLFGLIFGMITLVDDGIEAAMGAHSANNIFVCIMVTQKSSALQTPALFEQHNIYPWTDFTGLLLTGIIFFIILKVIFRWNNLKVIFGKVTKKDVQVQEQ